MLQARGNIDPIAEKIISLDHYVSEVYADPEHNAAFNCNLFLLNGKLFLYCRRTGNCSDNRSELRYEAITHQFDCPTTVLCYERSEHGTP